MIERKAFTGPSALEAGAFAARVYVVGGPPDGDGDVILAVPPVGHKVLVSFGEHDAVLTDAEPAGEAALFEVGDTIIAHGRAFDSPRGAQLRAKLLKGGPNVQWSIGWSASPDAGFRSRRPTSEELKRWPDAKRVITAWSPIEISPVRTGSCGPTCRTISAKSAGNTCACSSKQETLDPGLVKEVKRLQAFVECLKEPHGALAWDVAQCSARWMSSGLVQEGPAVKWFDPDGKRLGYWRPGDDAVHLSRGLSESEVIRVCAHEAAGHWWHNWDSSEATARLAEQYVVRLYRERLAAA